MIKCVFWGGPVNTANAVNTGQWRNQFQVVIAGSNGYMNNSIVSPPGYGTANDLGNAAINAPLDSYGFNSYMGSAMFNSGPFNASLCAEACSTKSAYNLAHPPTDGSPVQTCQFFNTYILYINNTNNLQGQYCAMYSESWSSTYATNVGQYQGNNHFLIEYSYSYSNSTNAGTACENCAVHQASKDISYSSLQTYCSTLLGYTAPVMTTTVTSTSTATTTTTIYDEFVTISYYPYNKRAAVPTAPAAAVVEARSLSTPVALTKYPGAVITSACSLEATPVTTTSTSTVVVNTAVTVTSTVSSD